MVCTLGPQPDARSFVQPKPRPFRLPLRNLEPFSAPNTSNALLVDGPVRLMQQRCNAPIAVAAILPCQFNDVGRQRGLVIGGLWNRTLCRAMLPNHAASKSLRDTQRLNNMFDTSPAPCRAQNLPEATSFKTSFSSVKSETARRSRAFSASSSFMRFT